MNNEFIDLATKWLEDNITASAVSHYAPSLAGLLADVQDKERGRCADIVSAARFGEVDQDFRAVHHMIEGGRTAAEIKL